MHRGQTTAVGPTAKHDAVGHQRGECAALRSVTISTAWPARSAGLWAFVASPAYLLHIDPAGPSSAPAKCCVVYRYATEEQLAVGCRRGRIHSTRFAHSRPA